MSRLNNLLPLTTWMKSRQAILLFGLLLATAYAFASFYYSGSVKKADHIITVPDASIMPPTVSEDKIADPATTDVQTTTSLNGSAPAQTTVQVNGQNIPVPQSGTIHKVIQSGNGNTSVDVSVQSNTTSGQGANSSTNVDLNSSSVEFNSTTEASQ